MSAERGATVREAGRDLRHHAARRLPARGRLGDRRGQAAHRRAARPARRPLHRGRLAGRQPQGRGVLPPGRHRAAPRPPRRSWPSAPPAGSRARSTTTRRCATWSRPARLRSASSGKSWDYHVTDALGTTLAEGEAMVGDSVEFLVGNGSAGAVRRRALLRRLQAQPGVQPPGAGGGGREGRQPPGAVRHQRRVAALRGGSRSSARSRATSVTMQSSRSTPTTTPAAPWPTPSPRCAPAPARSRARSTGSASARATATSRRSSPT